MKREAKHRTRSPIANAGGIWGWMEGQREPKREGGVFFGRISGKIILGFPQLPPLPFDPPAASPRTQTTVACSGRVLKWVVDKYAESLLNF